AHPMKLNEVAMRLSCTEADLADITRALKRANSEFSLLYPGDSSERQPVHSVYGGANLFKAGSARKLGQLALNALKENAANYLQFAHAMGLPGASHLPVHAPEQEALLQQPRTALSAEALFAEKVYQRVVFKLENEPVEDQRVDFEDGYGNRPDAEEDGHAITAAEEIAKGMAEKTLPPYIGIRVKTFSEECYPRAVRTLDLFLTHLAQLTDARLPDNFVITLPKVVHADQVSALTAILDVLEHKLGFASGSLKIEIMVETPQAIIGASGTNELINMIKAAKGRCRGAHFGTFDYTASVGITAAHQAHKHAASDFARHAMQVALAGTGVMLSDGVTTQMPIGPHKGSAEKPLTDQQREENRRVVHSAWKIHFDNVWHSLVHGYYQGWDLNPAQLPVRYAAVYAFFLQGLPDASRRLQAFINKAAQATLSGNNFDDAATGQGLLNFFLRGIACGAITEEEALATGISIEELRTRSFLTIVKNRAEQKK
ncbi:MAG TPA: hypothetical protein VFM46_02160, partial [Pseudomonadales bacterium]|nr:hypothetical protein [Pseudomonadales bacterium]